MTHFLSLIEAVTADAPNKSESLPDRNTTEFSSRKPGLWLTTYWQRRDKVKSAVISSAVYDSSNRKRAECVPKKVSFNETATRVIQQLSLAGLEAGNYRVDIIADGTVVGRRIIRILN